jgi:hypothetical protein
MATPRIDEDGDGDGEQDALDDGHTRSSAQMSPSMARTKPTMPRAERKSAMSLTVGRVGVNRL